MKIQLEPEVREELEQKIPEVLKGLSEEARANLVVNLFRNAYDNEGRKLTDSRYNPAGRIVRQEVSPAMLESVVDTLINRGAKDDLYFLGKIMFSSQKYSINPVIKIAEAMEQELLNKGYDDTRSLDDLFRESGRFAMSAGEVFKDAAVDVVQPKDGAPKELLTKLGEMCRIASFAANDEQRENLEDKALVYSIKGGSFKTAADILDRKHRRNSIRLSNAELVDIMRKASCLAAAGEFRSAGYAAEEVANKNDYGSLGSVEVRDDKILAEYAMRVVEFFARAGETDKARRNLIEYGREIERQTGFSADDLFQQGLEYCKNDEERVLFAIEFKRCNVRNHIGSKAEARTYDEVIDLAGDDTLLKARAAFECGRIQDAVEYLEQSDEILGAARLAKNYEVQYKDSVEFWKEQVDEKKRCDEQKVEYWASKMYRDPTVELEEAVGNHRFFSERASRLYHAAVEASLDENNPEEAEKIARESGDYDLVAYVKAQSDGELAEAYEVFKFVGLSDTREATERVLEDSLLHSDFATAHVAAKRLKQTDKANEYAFLHETLREYRDEKDFSFYCPNSIQQS